MNVKCKVKGETFRMTIETTSKQGLEECPHNKSLV